MAPDTFGFGTAFKRFQKLVAVYSGHQFTNLNEGLSAVWESYKPKLRDFALSKLDAADWQHGTIGQGRILERTIAAIEIQDNRPGGLTNNLVFWQNRYGHLSREHRALLDAQQDQGARRAIESTLFDLYRADVDEAALFDRLSELTGRKYTLSAYLYFLKDMRRFMPIQPTGFDRVFHELGVQFTSLRNCNWDNYKRFNEILGEVRLALEEVADLKNVRLIDAHSFCWIFATLLKRVPEGTETVARKNHDDGRILGARERSITNMRLSILNTVSQSRGQIVTRNMLMKVKDLGFDSERALEAYLRERIKIQGDCCALTGIPFHFHGDFGSDKNLLPSPDRIDSDGHYEPGNIQVVCQFVNMWKSNTKNDEFLRLLTLIRNQENGAEPEDAPLPGPTG
jgi:hypothetical protein